MTMMDEISTDLENVAGHINIKKREKSVAELRYKSQDSRLSWAVLFSSPTARHYRRSTVI